MQIIVNLFDPSSIRAAMSLMTQMLDGTPVVHVPAGGVIQPGDIITGGPSTGLPPHPGVVAMLAPATNGDGRDGEGCPWDERIHASTKTKTAKGIWTRRKGIEDAVYASVRAQLMAGGQPASLPPSPAAETASPSPVPTGVVAQVPVVPPVLAPTPPPIAAPEPTFPPDGWLAHPTAPGYFYCGQEVLTEAQLREKVKPVVAAPVTWLDLCQVMNEKLTAGKLDMEKLNAIGAKYQTTPFAMLATKQNLWPQVLADLQAA